MRGARRAGSLARAVEMSAPVPVPPSPRAARLALGGAAAIALLALVETVVALVAPSRAPTDGDWDQAASVVRQGFQPGDLIVAAPAWADQILRVHLGDLIPATVAARMDDERYARVWEVSQRGARSPEGRRGQVTLDRAAGRLRVRLIERPAPVVTYDFVARGADARLARRGAGGAPMPCPPARNRLVCPGAGGATLERKIVEVAQRLRVALMTEPMPGATVTVEFPAVPLGRVLAIATGLHDTWMRKAARGTVQARLFIGDRAVELPDTTDDSGWTETRVDTAAQDGRTVPVRLEITSAQPLDRFFAFAAEARR